MNLTDRCDASASGSEAAQDHWVLPGIGDLRLCAHHSAKHLPALNAGGWVLVQLGNHVNRTALRAHAAERGES